MPNHYTTIAICRRNYDSHQGEQFDAEKFQEKYKQADLLRMLRPEPDGLADSKQPHILTSGSLAWRIENWGTKWDIYDLKAYQLPGDGRPVAIAFCTAWSAPFPMLPLLAEWLKKEHGMSSVMWVGSDPYDDSTHEIGGES